MVEPYRVVDNWATEDGPYRFQIIGPRGVAAPISVMRYSNRVDASVVAAKLNVAFEEGRLSEQPIPMLLWCPFCLTRHIDHGEFTTKLHHTHACQGCGFVWRPALVPTVGVQFLPGFKDQA